MKNKLARDIRDGDIIVSPSGERHLVATVCVVPTSVNDWGVNLGTKGDVSVTTFEGVRLDFSPDFPIDYQDPLERE